MHSGVMSSTYVLLHLQQLAPPHQMFANETNSFSSPRGIRGFEHIAILDNISVWIPVLMRLEIGQQ